MQISVTDHHALETLLDEVQGSARARALTPGAIAQIARAAEAELDTLRVSSSDRKGCEYVFLPRGHTTRRYARKAPRAAATWIRLRREADGWYLVAADRRPRRMASEPSQAGQLWIIPAVHEELVRIFSRQFRVLDGA